VSESLFEYAPAPESTSVVSLESSYGLFINGEFVSATSDEAMKTVNPATEEVLSEIAVASAADVDRAVAAARTAYDTVWGTLPGAERAKYLYRIARLLQERAREFAVLESLDNGKPIKESRDVDIPLAAAHFFYHAGWAEKLEWAGLGSSPSPLGVAGQVIPWNFPLLMLSWKIAPALATGNTVVLKPAETTPLTALLFASVCQQADLPPGVVNIVTGAGATGAALVAHPGIDKVAFTGSTDVGREIARTVAGSRKKVTLELGGKAANIVFDDAPIDQAIEGIVNGIFFNQGHVCCAGSRLLVQESVAPEVISRLEARLATLRVGDPLDKNTDVGAINSRAQLDRITSLVSAGEAEGAVRWSPACSLPERGYWFAPTVFTEVAPSHRIAREEIFGPVLSVLTFRTFDEAVAKANHTPYGLSAGVWSEKGSRILAMADRLRAGVVWANTFNRFDPTSPFGGYKESGYGREGGRHGLAGYVTSPVEPAASTVTPAETEPTQTGPVAETEPTQTGPVAETGPEAGPVADARLAVAKTYKLYVGGAFPRSESGRSYPVSSSSGSFLANAAQASRKDVRDAVVAARKAFPGWSSATAYNRGQVLYRVAEMMEGRRSQFVSEVARSEGVADAASVVDAAIDRWVWYAGWTDKLAQVAGAANPVAGPYFNITAPEPTGVVGVLAPQSSSLLGLVSVVAPVLAAGNTCVVLTSQTRPLPAITLGEVLATSDVPGGVVNVLSGVTSELAPWLASHEDVNGLDLTGATAVDWGALEAAAASSLTRVLRPAGTGDATYEPDFTRVPDGPARALTFTELKTVWHPKGR
jgi:aldehyde dehydrogenase (NAD+)